MGQQSPQEPEKSPGGEDGGGTGMLDLLELPASQRRLLHWMLRKREVGAAELAEFARGDDDAVAAALASLVERGLVRTTGGEGGVRYSAVITSRSTRPRAPSRLWGALESKDDA